ncbi:uncharacterized protein B0T23DRAFT_99540 [Neurospora hispaniola]|uniref:Uncharacterized protein n=1 Tax=Neurospora hispaniola TaxID=588809 RepID=A0AAJ0MUG4_9PEZI|nr:hypothetical protein B0T23DRAFT_99540 [Neurospora hispaniola]
MLEEDREREISSGIVGGRHAQQNRKDVEKFSRNGITKSCRVVILLQYLHARHKQSIDSCHDIFVLLGCLKILDMMVVVVVVVWLMSCPMPILAWHSQGGSLQPSDKGARLSAQPRGRKPSSSQPQPAHAVGWLGFDWTGTRERAKRRKASKKDW